MVRRRCGILGPVAAAAGVAAGAYLLLKQNLDKMNAAMKEANELATKNQILFDEVRRAAGLGRRGNRSNDRGRAEQTKCPACRLFTVRRAQATA